MRRNIFRFLLVMLLNAAIFPALSTPYFLGIGNGPGGGPSENDDFWNALKLWGSWRGVTPVLKDDLTGPQIVAEIGKFRGKLRAGDQLVFFYAGHGGETPDNNNDERPPGATSAGDEAIGTAANAIRDDELAAALNNIVVPSVTTMIIMSACSSGGFWGGANDLNSVANVHFLASIREGARCGLFDFTKTAAEGLTISKGFGNADANRNGTVTMNELFRYIDARANQNENPVQFSNADAQHQRHLAAIPAPSSLWLLVAAIGALRFSWHAPNKR